MPSILRSESDSGHVAGIISRFAYSIAHRNLAQCAMFSSITSQNDIDGLPCDAPGMWVWVSCWVAVVRSRSCCSRVCSKQVPWHCRFVTSSSHGRRPLQTGGAPVDGPLPWELGFEFPMYRKAPSSSEDSSAAVKGGSAKTPKAPKTPQSPVSSLYDNCKPKPMPPCPEELSSDYKDYPIVFFNGVMCRNDFKTLAELVSGENAGRKAGDSSAVNPSAQSPAPSSETESSHKFVPLCSEVYNGYRPPPSPTTMAPVSSDELPWCPGPAPINPACPPGISDGSSSSESSNGSSGGTSGGSSGANKTSVPTPAATAGSGEGESSSISDRESSSSGSNGSGSGTSANTTSDDGNSTSSSESDNNTTTPTMTPDPDGPDFNGTYRPMVCVDGKALKRNVEYTLVLLNATYPGINNCAQQDSLPGLVTLQYYVVRRASPAVLVLEPGIDSTCKEESQKCGLVIPPHNSRCQTRHAGLLFVGRNVAIHAVCC